MSGKIVSYNPKIVIINHFDELINRVDIEFEECIEKFNEHQILGDLECFDKKKRELIKGYYYEIVSLFESQRNCENQTVDLWSESTKVVEYLKQVRMKTIEELKKGQEETLEYYTLNSSLFKSSEEIKDENDFRSKLYGEKFYFQVRNKSTKKPWIFNLFTFVTDFYMSQSDINLLEMFISNYLSHIESIILNVNPIFDEKMVLISLLDRQFFHNLTHEKFPNHVIFVRKRDFLNIREINIPSFMRRVKLTNSSIDLSKLEKLYQGKFFILEEVELNGLSSITNLEFNLKSPKRFSAKNLSSLKELSLTFDSLIGEKISTRIFEPLSNINSLHLKGSFSNLNLDSLVNLEILSLSGKVKKGFNFGLFKNICNHLEHLSIDLKIDTDQINKLFDGHIFKYLKSVCIKSTKITKLEKKMFVGYPMLQNLNIIESKDDGLLDFFSSDDCN